MHGTRRMVALALGLAVSGCGDEHPVTAPGGLEEASLAAAGVVASVTGSGSHLRTGVDGDELTTFAFGAVRREDGETNGQWQYHFRAAGFSMHGNVSCLTIAGNQAWVGGAITKVLSPDPADQELVGVEMWWRSQDNGEGANASPDATTGLGFAFPGVPITAESWCRDQPQSLVVREVIAGNIRISGA